MDAEAVVARVARTGVCSIRVLLMLLVLTAAPVHRSRRATPVRPSR